MAEFSCFSLAILPLSQLCLLSHRPHRALANRLPSPSWLTGAVSDANTDVMTIGHKAHQSSTGPLEDVRPETPETPDACLFRGLNPSIQ